MTEVFELCGWSISAWSKAGIATCVTARQGRLSLAFDMGTCPERALSASHVFISHGHTDHVASLFAHARARSLSNDAATYYIPECALAPLQAAKRAFEQLDCHDGDEEIPMNFQVVKAGDEYTLDSNHSVRVFATDHRVPSFGYAILTREKGGLAPQYVGLPRDQLIALRDKGVEIQPVTTTVDLVYTGDTRIAGLDREPLVWQARVLITELSFLDDSVSIEGTEEKGHLHLYSIAERARAGKLDRVEAILFIHMSARYTHGETISQLVAAHWPTALRAKVHLALEAFFITDSRTEWCVANAFTITPSPLPASDASSSSSSSSACVATNDLPSPPSSLQSSIMCTQIYDADMRTSVASRLATLATRRGMRGIGAAAYRVPLAEAQAAAAANKDGGAAAAAKRPAKAEAKQKGEKKDKAASSKDDAKTESKDTAVAPTLPPVVTEWAYKVSLRSDKEDTLAIAKAYGGGGYPVASSFYVSAQVFESWMSKLPAALPPRDKSASSSSSSSKDAPKTSEKGKKGESSKKEHKATPLPASSSTTASSSNGESKRSTEATSAPTPTPSSDTTASSSSQSSLMARKDAAFAARAEATNIPLTLPATPPTPPTYDDGTPIVVSFSGAFPIMGHTNATEDAKKTYPMLKILRHAIDGCADFQEKVYDTHRTFHYNRCDRATFPNPSVGRTPYEKYLLALRRECRGLIVDRTTGRPLARRFHKFFNLNENEESKADLVDLSLPHVSLEKLDGSLAAPAVLTSPPSASSPSSSSSSSASSSSTSSTTRMRWLTMSNVDDKLEGFVHAAATTGVAPPSIGKSTSSTNNGETKDALVKIDYNAFATHWINRGYTPLLEWCCTDMHTVRYRTNQLVLLAIRHTIMGHYISWADLQATAKEFGIPVTVTVSLPTPVAPSSSSTVPAPSSATSSDAKAATAMSHLTSTIRSMEGIEGIVLRMDDGTGRMYKIKSEWYVALSTLGISGKKVSVKELLEGHHGALAVIPEKVIWNMALQDRVDDVLPLLVNRPSERDRLANFCTQINDHVTALVDRLFVTVNELVTSKPSMSKAEFMKSVKTLAEETKVPQSLLPRIYDALFPKPPPAVPAKAAKKSATKKGSSSSPATPPVVTAIVVDTRAIRGDVRSSLVASIAKLASNDIEEARRLLGGSVRWIPS